MSDEEPTWMKARGVVSLAEPAEVIIRRMRDADVLGVEAFLEADDE